LVSFSRYLLTAGTATIVDVTLVQLCLQFGVDYGQAMLALAIAVGAASGTMVNFLLSRRFVFRPDGRRAHEQFATFLTISLTTALLRMVLAYGLVAILTLPAFALLLTLPVSAPAERIAHLGAVGLVTIYSFLAHRHFSFAGGLRNRLFTRTTTVS
jgi:putative flippase GtrA